MSETEAIDLTEIASKARSRALEMLIREFQVRSEPPSQTIVAFVAHTNSPTRYICRISSSTQPKRANRTTSRTHPPSSPAPPPHLTLTPPQRPRASQTEDDLRRISRVESRIRYQLDVSKQWLATTVHHQIDEMHLGLRLVSSVSETLTALQAAFVRIEELCVASMEIVGDDEGRLERLVHARASLRKTIADLQVRRTKGKG